MIVVNEATCPKCGHSHYRVVNSSVTCICVPPGTPVEDNPNITTSECECLDCGERFTVEYRGGKVISVTDHGNPNSPKNRRLSSVQKSKKLFDGGSTLTSFPVSNSIAITQPRVVKGTAKVTIDLGQFIFQYKGKDYHIDADTFVKLFGKEIK